MNAASPVLCIAGPTAVGKTGVGIDVARWVEGEVIGCDAFAVYRGMRILSAAPEAPADVPHHLVGMIDPSDSYSAAQFAKDADRLVSEIRICGREPIVVGGTALYLRSWLAGFGAPVPRDEAFRSSLRARAEAEGKDVLHDALRAVDPERALDLHKNDVRRVIRALEIHHLTGRRPSTMRGQWTGSARVPARVVCLERTADDLARRILERTTRMFEDGVVDEARALLQAPLSPEARKILGLDELERLLHAETSEREALARIAQRTRQLAKKQMTFFRGFPEITFVSVEADEDDASVADRVRKAAQDA